MSDDHDESPIESRHAEFVIAVGDTCVIAVRAELVVELETFEGEVVSGIPSRVASPAEVSEVDDTGYGNAVALAGRELALDQVVRCTVFAPVE